MNNELEISEKNQQSMQKLQEQKDSQILTLQKMRDLEKLIELEEDKKEVIKNIIKVDNISLSPNVKINEAYLVELENELSELQYQLYTESGIIGRSNENSLIELDPAYIEEQNEKFGVYGSEYLIPVENQLIDPEQLQEQSLEPYSKVELEETLGNEYLLTQDEQEEQKEENYDEKMSKMESDLGYDISSCVMIQDDDFSQEVLGHQTGHEEKYIAYSKSRNTFILIGESNNEFEEIQDICAAQGGGEASSKTYIEYDEDGRGIEVEAPSFVMTRNDGTAGAIAIDMNYGQICVSNLTPKDQEPGKYTNEEIMIGHSIRPTPEEIEQAKEREEKAKAIKAKEKEVEGLENDIERGENKLEELDQSKQELEDMQKDAEDDDEIYDWSTGRPVPRH